jgi:hypothetical protein
VNDVLTAEQPEHVEPAQGVQREEACWSAGLRTGSFRKSRRCYD